MTMIDLDALTNPARLPKVKLFGREMTVRPLTGAAAHKIAATQEKDAAGSAILAALLDILPSIMPDVTADEAALLSVDQLAAIMQLARGQVADVEQQLADAAAKN